MGRTGSCFDNAVAESFFATLKTEIGTKIWPTRHAARRAVFDYLTYYNQHRLHSTNGYQTPVETRLGYSQDHALAGINPGVRSQGGSSGVFGGPACP
jgi:putative transposase